MHAEIDLDSIMDTYQSASGFLLDTHNPDLVGGTGEHFDWKRVPHNTDQPIILAGGLNARNIHEAITLARPFGIDISGGVESAKGIKDAEKIRLFFDAVHNANESSL